MMVVMMLAIMLIILLMMLLFLLPVGKERWWLVKIDTWISLSCYMNFSKLRHEFFFVVIWICQNWYMDFSVVGLGRLCLWQCFVLIRHDSWGYNRSKLPNTIFWTVLTPKTKKTYNCTWCLQHLHAQRRAGTFSPFKFGLHLSRGFFFIFRLHILVYGKHASQKYDQEKCRQ